MGAMNNFSQMISEFNRFNQNFKGNPQEEVQKLLNSGQINQSQLNDLQYMANQFQQLINQYK